MWFRAALADIRFWNETDPERKADERRAFLTDISLIGGLIIAAVDTEGKPSLGWRGRRAAAQGVRRRHAALPVGAASGGALADSAIADKVGHGLQVGAERGRELAHVAREAGSQNWPERGARSERANGREMAELPANAEPSWPRSPANAAPK